MSAYCLENPVFESDALDRLYGEMDDRPIYLTAPAENEILQINARSKQTKRLLEIKKQFGGIGLQRTDGIALQVEVIHDHAPPAVKSNVFTTPVQTFTFLEHPNGWHAAGENVHTPFISDITELANKVGSYGLSSLRARLPAHERAIFE